MILMSGNRCRRFHLISHLYIIIITIIYEPCHHEMVVDGQEKEPLLGVIREQGECLYRHKGAGSKGQNSQGSREHENCNSLIFISLNTSFCSSMTQTNLALSIGKFQQYMTQVSISRLVVKYTHRLHGPSYSINMGIETNGTFIPAEGTALNRVTAKLYKVPR